MSDARVERLLEAALLKDVPRAGWVRHGVPGVESVAAHSWGVAWLTLLLLPPGLDRGRALAYAVLHDLPEVRTGDLTPADGVPRDEKLAMERRAMTDLVPAELLAVWDAYEAQADDEARFVRQIDRLDMAVQAVVYARRDGRDLTEFLDSAAEAITDFTLREILERLRG